MSVGGLLGTNQLGLHFDEGFTFLGVEYEVKDVVERKVDHVVEQWSTKMDHTVDIPHGIWASK